VTRGFCVNREGEARLMANGVEPKSIYMRGRGAENMDWCLRSFRGRPGVLKVADDLTIFGQARQDIFGVTKALHTGKIGLCDVVTGETNPHELEHRALKILSSKNGACDPRTARKRGRIGGYRKGVTEKARRNAAVSDEIVERVCASRLTWDEKSFILGIPESTLRRNYKF